MPDVVEELGLIMFACSGAGLGAVRNFQKQRSTPKVRLSEVNMDNDEEIVHAEVEDFG